MMKNKNWTPKFIALAVVCLLIGAGIGLLSYHYLFKQEVTPIDWQSTETKPTKLTRTMLERIILYENGKQASMDPTSELPDLPAKIGSLLVQKLPEVNLQVRCVFSEEDIQEIKRKDRVAELIFKEPIDITISQWVEPEERYHIPVDEKGYRILEKVKTALFILEDNLDEGLEAHILVGHLIPPEPGLYPGEEKIGYSCWAININPEGKPELDKSWIDKINWLLGRLRELEISFRNFGAIALVQQRRKCFATLRPNPAL
jgi:hypothetical protein